MKSFYDAIKVYLPVSFTLWQIKNWCSRKKACNAADRVFCDALSLGVPWIFLIVAALYTLTACHQPADAEVFFVCK